MRSGWSLDHANWISHHNEVIEFIPCYLYLLFRLWWKQYLIFKMDIFDLKLRKCYWFTSPNICIQSRCFIMIPYHVIGLFNENWIFRVNFFKRENICNCKYMDPASLLKTIKNKIHRNKLWGLWNILFHTKMSILYIFIGQLRKRTHTWVNLMKLKTFITL